MPEVAPPAPARDSAPIAPITESDHSIIRPAKTNRIPFSADEVFDAVALSVASPEQILAWSHGEVKKPETINYRTQKPEKGGLFCEVIFGPIKNWECYCGKYKKVKYKGIVCEKCGVEVTRKIVRRERMGHIKLAAPVTHSWFLRSMPSRIGLLLDVSVRALEQVVAFASYIVKEVHEDARQSELKKLDEEVKAKEKEIRDGLKSRKNDAEILAKEAGKKSADGEELEALETEAAAEIDALREEFLLLKKELTELRPHQILTEMEYVNLRQNFGHVFEAGIGAEAIRDMISKMDLPKILADLKAALPGLTGAKRERALKRIRLLSQFIKAKVQPEWMIWTVVPVLPPELRPMVPLEGGRYASSDINDLYRRIINRNNRLKRLIEIGAPEVIQRNEKRMLQESVDALIDAAKTASRSVFLSGERRKLKSLSEILKGKQGRFRQNLLGKRVDYSGRSVIVSNPRLQLDECGLPKKMALELFKPKVIGELVREGIAAQDKAAERMIEDGEPEVFDALEKVAAGNCVLLNRAPTLHRLGVQAFRPRLIEGRAIQIHPLVCKAFNADFDGDQMAVHLPLSEAAQKEAREIMLSKRNILSPATGRTIIAPSQDMVFGAWYLTEIENPDAKAEDCQAFGDDADAIRAYEYDGLALREKIRVRRDGEFVETSVGRLIFNSVLPAELPFWNEVIGKKQLGAILDQLFEKFGYGDRTTEVADRIKTLGFKFATKSGYSMGIFDFTVPAEKAEILSDADATVEKINKMYRSGLITGSERENLTIKTWFRATEGVSSHMDKAFRPSGEIAAYIRSGSRGSMGNVAQTAGMKGIVQNSSGRSVELPVKSSFIEGLSILEYFIATMSGRKGLSDVALNTAQAGYLTRRLVDTAQDVVVREEDCGNREFLTVTRAESEDIGGKFSARIFGRTLAKDLAGPDGKTLFPEGTILRQGEVKEIDELGLDEIPVRSVLSCQAKKGVCRHCYGADLSRLEPVQLGEPVGIVAAQSLGEPSTQLTLHSKHAKLETGGVNIVQGLPRAEEVFEARNPKNESLMSEIEGTIEVVKMNRGRKIIVHGDAPRFEKIVFEEGSVVKVEKGDTVKARQGLFEAVGATGKRIVRAGFAGKVEDVTATSVTIRGTENDAREHDASEFDQLLVTDGDRVRAGQHLTAGNLNIRELLAVTDLAAAQRYVVAETQKVYLAQGIEISEQHFEVIIREMFGKVTVLSGGDSDYLAGDVITRVLADAENAELIAAGKKPIVYEQMVYGLTRTSLHTESWLAAASFQETIRVLIAAAVSRQVDNLSGLKENVIIGRLLPAGETYRKKAAGEDSDEISVAVPA